MDRFLATILAVIPNLHSKIFINAIGRIVQLGKAGFNVIPTGYAALHQDRNRTNSSQR